MCTQTQGKHLQSLRKHFAQKFEFSSHLNFLPCQQLTHVLYTAQNYNKCSFCPSNSILNLGWIIAWELPVAPFLCDSTQWAVFNCQFRILARFRSVKVTPSWLLIPGSNFNLPREGLQNVGEQTAGCCWFIYDGKLRCCKLKKHGASKRISMNKRYLLLHQGQQDHHLCRQLRVHRQAQVFAQLTLCTNELTNTKNWAFCEVFTLLWNTFIFRSKNLFF